MTGTIQSNVHDLGNDPVNRIGQLPKLGQSKIG
jgi:hypothetical protein